MVIRHPRGRRYGRHEQGRAGAVRSQTGKAVTGVRHSPFDALPLVQAGSISGGLSDSCNLMIWGDNLHAMRSLPAGSVDLIYADPPFFTNREFPHLYDGTQNPMFSDVWSEGMDGYLSWLEPRIVEMRRLLSMRGSIYVHLDWHASHYVKTMMDRIFGYGNFLNEIIWHYRDPAGTVRDRFKKKHDTILFYARHAGKHIFNIDEVRMEYSPGTIEQGRRGTISFGRPTRLNSRGKAPEDVWDIPIINSQARERTGYPTQKPLRLLQTVVRASSTADSTVADFFGGSGTTAIAAQALGRRWISADISEVAVRTALERLGSTAEAYGSRRVMKLMCGIIPLDGGDLPAEETVRSCLGLPPGGRRGLSASGTMLRLDLTADWIGRDGASRSCPPGGTSLTMDLAGEAALPPLEGGGAAFVVRGSKAVSPYGRRGKRCMVPDIPPGIEVSVIPTEAAPSVSVRLVGAGDAAVSGEAGIWSEGGAAPLCSRSFGGERLLQLIPGLPEGARCEVRVLLRTAGGSLASVREGIVL